MHQKLEKFQTIFLIAGIGFFLISFIGMGLAPWTTLKSLRPPEGAQPYTDLEKLGRQIYMEEGCWHCHTQFVRPVANEPLRYGPVSTANEYMYEIPQLFGTRRVGPDLAREAGKRSDDWQYAHLYNPQSTVPWSVMPGFPWLFEKKDGKIVPTQKAKALVAYLQSLGRAQLPTMRAQDSVYQARFTVGTPPMKTVELVQRGAELFQRECSGCHGPTGDGNGTAKPFLLPPAQNLKTSHPTPWYVYKILHLGRPGSSMPHFRQYSEQDLWALAFYVESLYEEPPIPQDAPIETAELLELGKQKYAMLCSSCHGPKGRGDGVVARSLKPSPADFIGLRPSPVRVVEVLNNGVPGTAMVAFPQLTPQEKWALAYYIWQLIRKSPSTPTPGVATATAPAPTSATPLTNLEALTPPPPTEDLLARGKELFNSTCSTCHGAEGTGKGPASASLQPPPANFTDQTWKHGGTIKEIFRTITQGSPGTAMAPYAHLPENDRWALAYYVKSFSDTKLRAMVK